MSRTIPMHGNLSPDAHEAWHAVGDTNLVSVTALLEALGLSGRLDQICDTEIVDAARRIDHERRHRSRNRGRT